MNEIEDRIKRLKALSIILNEEYAKDIMLAITAIERHNKISRYIKEGRYYCPICDRNAKAGYCECGQNLY